MPSARASALSPLPAELSAAAAMFGQAVTALGWLDHDLRLRWANVSLLDIIGGGRLPAAGLALDDVAVEAQRLMAAVARVRLHGGVVHLPAVHFRAGDIARSVDITALEEVPGLLLEVRSANAPATVSVAASLRSLAHELKNPLGGLRGAAQLLSRRVLDPDLRAYAGIIIAEVDRLGALTGRLLAPANRAPQQAVNVHAVLERVRLLLEAEGSPVERDYDPSLPEAFGDGDRLVQVFLNLARNAIQAGAGDVRLRTRFERAAQLQEGRGAALRIDVVDDGGGVDDGVRATLFLPLVTGREGGTGLGLATAREIVAEHGGRIGFESRPGHTVFSVWLPVDDKDGS